MAGLLGPSPRDRCKRPPPTVRELAEVVGLATGAVATRYDKLAVRYRATVHIAAINEWL